MKKYQSEKKLKNHKKIFLIDDNSSIRYIVEQIVNTISVMNDFSYELYIYESVDDYDRNNGFNYDYAIVDWNLGFEEHDLGSYVIEKLRKKQKDKIKITILSGQTDDFLKTIKNYCLKHSIGFILKGKVDANKGKTGLIDKIKNFICD